MQVSCLRVAGAAGLLLPGRVLLDDLAQLTEGLAVARGGAAVLRGQERIRPVALPELDQERLQPGRELSAHGREAEGREGHDEAVELARPVDQAIATGVADQDVAPGAAVGQVLIGGVGVGCVVQAAVGVLVVVGVQQVIAPAAVHPVPPGPADQPVIAEVAEEGVVAVRGQGCVRGARDPVGVDRALVGVEVKQPVVAARRLGRARARNRSLVERAVAVEHDLAQRIVGVVLRELGRTRVVTEDVARVVRVVEVTLDQPADLVAVLVVVVRPRLHRRLGA